MAYPKEATEHTAVVMVGVGTDLVNPVVLLQVNGTHIPMSPAVAHKLAESLTRSAALVEYEAALIAQFGAMNAEIDEEGPIDPETIAALIGAVRGRIYGSDGTPRAVIHDRPLAKRAQTG